MSTTLDRARATGVALVLHSDGRITWHADQPLADDFLAELRARREEVRSALLCSLWPVCLTEDPAEVILRGELDEIERENQR